MTQTTTRTILTLTLLLAFALPTSADTSLGVGLWKNQKTVRISVGPVLIESNVNYQRSNSSTKERFHIAALRLPFGDHPRMRYYLELGAIHDVLISKHGERDDDFSPMVGIGVEYRLPHLFAGIGARMTDIDVDDDRTKQRNKPAGVVTFVGWRW